MGGAGWDSPLLEQRYVGRGAADARAPWAHGINGNALLDDDDDDDDSFGGGAGFPSGPGHGAATYGGAGGTFYLPPPLNDDPDAREGARRGSGARRRGSQPGQPPQANLLLTRGADSRWPKKAAANLTAVHVVRCAPRPFALQLRATRAFWESAACFTARLPARVLWLTAADRPCVLHSSQARIDELDGCGVISAIELALGGETAGKVVLYGDASDNPPLPTVELAAGSLFLLGMTSAPSADRYGCRTHASSRRARPCSLAKAPDTFCCRLARRLRSRAPARVS